MLVGGMLTQMSGSLGGITASHNRGGLYLRARAIPVNPATPQQETVRQATSFLTDAWNNTLTAAQREAWTVYADNVPIANKLGNVGNIPGLAMYVRSNVPRIQAALPVVNDGPTNFTLGSFTEPSFGGDATADEVDVTFDNTDAWANEDDAALLVYASRPQNVTKVFFKGPYRLAGIIAGDSATAPTSPAAIAAPFAFVAGQRVFCFVRASRADGRLSEAFRGFALGA